MEDWSLRPAVAADAEFLLRLYAGTREAELAQTGWGAAERDAFVRMQFRAQDLDYRRRFAQARFDVVETGGEAVGRLYVDAGGAEIQVLDIALVPAVRGRGLGTALLRSVLAEARRSARAVSLHAERRNPAAGLYRRLGFEVVDEQDFRLLMRWEPTTAHSSPGAVPGGGERALAL